MRRSPRSPCAAGHRGYPGQGHSRPDPQAPAHQIATVRGELAPPMEIPRIITRPGAARRARGPGTSSPSWHRHRRRPRGRLSIESERGPLHVWGGVWRRPAVSPGREGRVEMAVQPVEWCPPARVRQPRIRPRRRRRRGAGDTCSTRQSGPSQDGTCVESPTGPCVWVRIRRSTAWAARAGSARPSRPRPERRILRVRARFMAALPVVAGPGATLQCRCGFESRRVHPFLSSRRPAAHPSTHGSNGWSRSCLMQRASDRFGPDSRQHGVVVDDHRTVWISIGVLRSAGRGLDASPRSRCRASCARARQF